MLRRYRAFLAVLWLCLFGANSSAIAATRPTDAAERSAKALESIAQLYGEQARQAEDSKHGKPCKKGEENRQSELCAQWSAADSAGLAAWLSGASFIGVLVALYLAFRSNSIARATAHNQLRAYVTLGDVQMRYRQAEPGTKKWFIDVDLENKGQTPAFLRHFSINIGWRRSGIAEAIVDPIFSKSRDIEVVVAVGKPFGIFVEIDNNDFSPSALHDGDVLRISGLIHYKDIYGEERTSSYRLYADRDSWSKGSGEIDIYTSMTGNNCS